MTCYRLYEAHRWGEVDELYPHVLPTCLDRCAIAVHDNTFYFMGGDHRLSASLAVSM